MAEAKSYYCANGCPVQVNSPREICDACHEVAQQRIKYRSISLSPGCRIVAGSESKCRHCGQKSMVAIQGPGGSHGECYKCGGMEG